MHDIHYICSFVTGGPWRYQGFYFEFHAVCGPSELNGLGDPVNRMPSRAFLKAWEVFERLPAHEKQTYEAQFIKEETKRRRTKP